MSLVTLSKFAGPIALIALATGLGGCSEKNRCLTEGVAVEISSDHRHSATVSPEHVKRNRGGTYRVNGDGHTHLFVLTDEEMQKLARGEAVTTRTSSANAHAHEVTLRCK